MKALYTFLIGCFCVGVTLAQSDIASVEYFFDVDPGIGNGTVIDINPDVELLNQNFSISTASLSQGSHRLFMRVVNSDGDTSFYVNKTFLIADVPETNSADITDAEYFFDVDPGIGSGTNIDITDIANLDENLLISTSSLSVGTHRLFIRVKNANNFWSMYTNKTFRVSDVPATNNADIVEAEYYFNTDPGIGSATSIDVTDVSNLDENFLIATASLPIGTHRLFIRVKNANNLWSMYANKTFRVSDVPDTNNADIVEAEYYFNTDPGFGLGTSIDVADIDTLDEDLLITTSGLPVGTHRLFLRVKNSNNLWSIYTNKVFRVSDVPFTNNATIVAAEYFIDVDPGFGNGIAIEVSGDALDENIIASTSNSLAQGDHFLYIRVLNADDTWSLYARELFEVDGTLNLNSEELASIKMYPNPTNDILNISIPAGNQITKAVIYDINGREVFRQEQHLETIHMANFQNGVYLLQLETVKGAISKKIIKN
jgi:5-deoxy-D-glucuronate isomerase